MTIKTPKASTSLTPCLPLVVAQRPEAFEPSKYARINSIPDQTHDTPRPWKRVSFSPSSLDSIGITSKQTQTKNPKKKTHLKKGWKKIDLISSKDPSRDKIIGSLFKSSMEREASKFAGCGVYQIHLRCSHNENHLLHVPYRCDLRICPECARRYAAKIWQRYKHPLDELARRGFEKRKTLKLLTLTKKKGRGKPTSELIRDLMKKAGVIIRKHFDGGLAVIEMGHDFNIHVHCVVYGSYVLQKDLSQEWLDITGDSPIVDIRRVKGHSGVLNYILKYISKPCNFDHPEDYAIYLKAITRSRRVHSFGVLYGLKDGKDTRKRKGCPKCGAPLKYEAGPILIMVLPEDCKKGGQLGLRPFGISPLGKRRNGT